MILRFSRRLVTEVGGRSLRSFALNFGAKGFLAGERHRRRMRRGVVVPPFLFISVTSGCNLRCRGCWAVGGRPARMDEAVLDRIIREWKAVGSSFFGILGGEPLLYEPLWRVLGSHRDCYFQLFTNGLLLDAGAAAAMARLGNVTPLISIEGLGAAGDERRGGEGVHGRALAALEECRRHGLLAGVATSVSKTNLADLVTEAFVRDVAARGAHYLWYYIYRPVGPDPAPELALDAGEILELRRFLVRMRPEAPLLLVDAYWDDRGRGLCPAAAGMSVHINPSGDIEPCPPVQFAAENVAGGKPLLETIRDSGFLRDFRRLAAETSRGCILMERPDLLLDLVRTSGARDTSGRGTGIDELRAMVRRPSHDMTGREVPETSWPYRLMKRRWFFGFGAYG